jgi:histidinol-phosphatase (PHP family)
MSASCEAAIAAGVTEIAFTDHVDYQPHDPGYGYYRPDQYLESVADVRAKYDGRLIILAGAEVDYHSETAAPVEAFIREYGENFDFIIGSVHYAKGGALIYPDYFQSMTTEQVFFDYFDEVERAVKTGWFNSIGHMDIPKRYLPRDRRNHDSIVYRDRLADLFRTMIDYETGFEINTSGIRQAPKTSMPGPVLVKWYAELGGRRITTGTDSHQAKTVGAGLTETLAMLKLCGIDSVLSFRQRQGILVAIDDLID